MHQLFFLIIFILLSSPFHALSQEILFQEPKAGISQNTVTSFCEDHLGFLWIGTQYGLNRYDGSRYRSFVHRANDASNKNQISSSNIECLLIDNEHNLWVGTKDKGINIMDVETLQFKNEGKYAPLISALKDQIITVIYQDSDDNFWIGTDRIGLLFWDPNSEESTIENISVHHPVVQVFEDEQEKIWFVNIVGDVCKINKDRKPVCEKFSEASNVRDAIYLQNGKLLLGGDQGLYTINITDSHKVALNQSQTNQSELFDQLLNSTSIISLLKDSQSRVWIGTENQGLFLYDIPTNEIQLFLSNEDDMLSINSNSIWSLYEDSRKNIWIGTFKKGFNQINPNEKIFKHNLDYAHLNFKGLVTDFEECHNSFWVSTDQDGLYKIDSKNVKKQRAHQLDSSELDSKVITCLLKDQSDNLWVGTWDKGLFIKRSGSQSFEAIPMGQNGVSSKSIKAIFEDSKGIIWISSFQKGIDRFDPKRNTFKNYQPSPIGPSILSVIILTIAEDGDGNIWLGSGGHGLNRIRVNSEGIIEESISYFSSSDDPNSISNNLINHLFVDSKKRIWIGTRGNGLDRYVPETDSFENFNTNHGLPSDVIFSILEDDHKQLWISTNQGLGTFNFEDNKINVKSFDLSYGLQSNEFNKSACYKANDGQLYFGGINGFNFFDPSKFSEKVIDPALYINYVEVLDGDEAANNSFELPKDKINLSASQDDINIDFGTLNFNHTSKNEYAYLLENHDSDWRYTTNNNIATYSNLRHGDYIFKVKSKKSNGDWSDKITQLEIIIAPYWYQTTIAFLVYAFLIFAFLYFIFSTLIHRQKLTSKLQIEKIKKNKEQEINNLRSQFFANISHELKTPLTLIIGPLKAVENENFKIDKRQSKSMLNNAERLNRLIDQILDLSKLESGMTKLLVTKSDIVETTKNICNNFKALSQYRSFEFEINVPNKPIHLFYEKEKMEQVIINLLSNAFKFTDEGGTVRVEIKELKDSVQLIVTDNGIGIPKEEMDLIFDRYYRGNTMTTNGAGLGLSITKQLIEMHQGAIKVYSEPLKGTSFEVNLLKGKNHFEKSQIQAHIGAGKLSENSKDLLNELQIFPAQKETVDSNNNDLPLLLIAEDNEEIRGFIKNYLKTNFRILEAKDGVEALELAKMHIPDMIITDLMMPRMDGFTLCENLRADEKTCHIFIGMLTVKTSEENQTKGFEKGVDFYLTKPFNPKLLALRIINILQTRQQFKAQLLDDIKFDIKPSERKVSPKDQIFLNDLTAVVEQNIDNTNFNVEDLSKAMAFSKSQLYRKMKGLLGYSANEFIRMIRLKHAKQLLEDGQLNITEIAYKVGFSDLKYFRSCFKKEFGMTPSQYKKQFAN